MNIRIVQGKLKLLGAGTTYTENRGYTKVTVLEIGDSDLRDITYTSYMENYLNRALSSGSEVKIAMWKNIIFALKMDGKVYQDDYLIGFWEGKMFAVKFIITIAMLGWPLLYFIPMYIYKKVKYGTTQSQRTKIIEQL